MTYAEILKADFLDNDCLDLDDLRNQADLNNEQIRNDTWKMADGSILSITKSGKISTRKPKGF